MKKIKKNGAVGVGGKFADPMEKKADPNGSYTGRPENKNEKPIQDADDL